MNEWMNESMNEWMNERMKEWIHFIYEDDLSNKRERVRVTFELKLKESRGAVFALEGVSDDDITNHILDDPTVNWVIPW